MRPYPPLLIPSPRKKLLCHLSLFPGRELDVIVSAELVLFPMLGKLWYAASSKHGCFKTDLHNLLELAFQTGLRGVPERVQVPDLIITLSIGGRCRVGHSEDQSMASDDDL